MQYVCMYTCMYVCVYVCVCVCGVCVYVVDEGIVRVSRVINHIRDLKEQARVTGSGGGYI